MLAVLTAVGAVVFGSFVAAPVTGADPVPAPRPMADELVGWATVNEWGQNGTTGGAGGQTVDVDTPAEFLSAIANTSPLVIRVNGMLSLPGPMHDVTSNKTIVGVGSGSGITGGGLNIGLPLSDDITSPPANAVKNVIIRNMNFNDWEDDAINVQMFSHHVWIDHNRWTTGGDGGVDIKRGSSYITVSWNHADGTDKNMLLGHDDDNAAQDVGRLRVTYHHNFFDGTSQRNPRVRFGDPVHVYNNYYLDTDDYGVASTENAGVLVEGNHFENVEDPYHLGEGDSGNGRLVARNNCFVNSEQGETGGSVGNPPYAYTLDPACDVKSIVQAGAGTGKVSQQPGPDPTDPSAEGLVGWATQAGGTTGGEGGQVVDVDTESEFLDVVESDTRQVIRVTGTIGIDGMVEVGSNKTIVGVGANSGFSGGGLTVENGVSNVIIQNLNFRGSDDDGVNVEEEAHHVWIDHNDISGTSDGTIDIKRAADYITVSWNHTHGQTKDMLLGHSDGNGSQDRGHLRVTYHHNWYDGTAERHPRVRFGNPVHVFNNYVANADYGVASTVEAGVLVENNYFENVTRPLAVGVFESDPGSLVHRGNVFVNSGAPEQAGTVNSIPYAYSLDPGADVKSVVMAGAGTGKI
ncbi:hypothetical protein BU204_08665 [Actinophytocola xanthii]|uniref:Pectate lyase domain-containing protein n=2 Tax=Actinophytocola xanthii TaxID=1912961 RepID=A0A1Q8CU37_9PSEU|nr:hypothetical protein BU204_08665 [Actinophytocola xanthii]